VIACTDIRRFALVGLLLLSGCSRQSQLPPIAGGLPIDLRQAEAAFNGRVRREFPPGTPLNVVQSKLAAEGFTVGRKGAELLRTRVPCQTKWAISWEAASGTITAIDSVYG
jgi:uncharacterized lipoprotein YajG